MTSDEQEALSHRHSHGFWLVPLASGAFAVFDHPNGKLLDFVLPNQKLDYLYRTLVWLGEEAQKRHESRTTRQSGTMDDELRVKPKVDLEGIDI